MFKCLKEQGHQILHVYGKIHRFFLFLTYQGKCTLYTNVYIFQGIAVCSMD